MDMKRIVKFHVRLSSSVQFCCAHSLLTRCESTICWCQPWPRGSSALCFCTPSNSASVSPCRSIRILIFPGHAPRPVGLSAFLTTGSRTAKVGHCSNTMHISEKVLPARTNCQPQVSYLSSRSDNHRSWPLRPRRCRMQSEIQTL